jgi:hypothetical protein
VENPFNIKVYVVLGSRKSAAAEGSDDAVLERGISSLNIPEGILKFFTSTNDSGSTPLTRVLRS